jgi:hypothetical protein
LTSLLQVSERLISSALHFESFVAGGASGNFFDFALGDLGDILGLGLLILAVLRSVCSVRERGWRVPVGLLAHEQINDDGAQYDDDGS